MTSKRTEELLEIDRRYLVHGFGVVGELETPGIEHLQAVVGERVVAGRDHHSGVEPAGSQDVRQPRRGNDPDVDRGSTPGA